MRRDDKGKIILDTRKVESLAILPDVLWTEPLPPHALENVDEIEIRVISFEVKITAS
ncbi:MAG: hypothetical protein ACK2T3_11400 [Candidatus Promineifilaceae bacterium]